MLLNKLNVEHLDALGEAAETYVQHAFGRRLNLTAITPSHLPHFILDLYKLWTGKLGNHVVIVMAIRHPRQGATSAYLKHRDLVREALHADIVLLLVDAATNAVRRQMVDRQIGFLSPGSQLYVPEALLDLRERSPTYRPTSGDHITPTTQLILLAHLQGIDMDDASLTVLAERFGVSIMTISRTFDELEALHIAKPRHIGRQRRGKITIGGSELWSEVRDRLQSPVRKTRSVTVQLPDHAAPLAGESALAHYSMLAAPRDTTRAVSAARWKTLQATLGVAPATAFDTERLEIETWSYDPRVLARDAIVDRLSLYLSVRGSPDERVAAAADEMVETMQW